MLFSVFRVYLKSITHQLKSPNLNLKSSATFFNFLDAFPWQTEKIYLRLSFFIIFFTYWCRKKLIWDEESQCVSFFFSQLCTWKLSLEFLIKIIFFIRTKGKRFDLLWCLLLTSKHFFTSLKSYAIKNCEKISKK